MTKGIKKEIWLYELIHIFDLKVEKHVLYFDSQSTLSLTKNLVYHDKMKHIYVMFNFIHEIQEEYKVSIMKINTKVNPINMLTKSLPKEKFNLYLDLVDLQRY